MPIYTTKNEPVRLGELLAYEMDQNYCRENVTFINNSGATASYVVGQCLEFFTPNYGPVATPANAIGVLLNDVPDIANAATKRIVMLARGPALLTVGKLITGAANLATCLTALAVLNIRTKPVVDSTDKTLLS